MAFDRQSIDFSLWNEFSSRFLAPLSYFDFRESLGEFVYSVEDYEARHSNAGKFRDVLSFLDEDGKSCLSHVRDVRIPNVSFIGASDPVRGFDSQQIRRISLFLDLAERFLGLFGSLECVRCEFPSDLVLQARELLPHMYENGEISNSHPQVFPLDRALRNVSGNKAEYKRRFVSENHSRLENHESAYRNGRDFFVFKNESLADMASDEEIIRDTRMRSKSGKSIYAETKRLSDFSNEEKRISERIEETKRRIIARYSVLYTENRDVLLGILDKCLTADFYLMINDAVALRGLNAVAISDSFDVAGAKNPFLGKPVPFSFSSKKRRFAITGSNGGGKTVFMRTICLLIMQNQFLTFISAESKGSLPIFTSLYLDVFDKQNVSEGLSGFTSRVRDLAEISCQSDLRTSLVMIDEIERGTGDLDGVVLYDAFNEFAGTEGFFMFVSTHSSRIKEHALLDAGIDKYSFFYDSGSGLPDYRMTSGICFETNAGNILRNAAFCPALKQGVVDSYESNKNEFSRDDILKRTMALIEEERGKGERLKALEDELREKEQRLILKERELNLMSIRVLEREKGLASFSQVRQTAKKNPVSGPSRADKKNSIQIRSGSDINAEISKLQSRLNDIAAMGDDSDFEQGDEIMVLRNGVRGKILETDPDKRKARVVCGSMILTLNFYEIRKESDLKPDKAIVHAVKTDSNARIVLDLRGRRRADAIEELEKQIDQALLASLPFFSVICGIGEGVIRQACVETLSRFSDRLEFEFSPDGGKIDVTFLS